MSDCLGKSLFNMSYQVSDWYYLYNIMKKIQKSSSLFLSRIMSQIKLIIKTIL